MIYGIGTDIVLINRFETWLDNYKKLNRFFTSNEVKEILEYRAIKKIASKWVIKEAFSKAVMTSLFCMNLKDIEYLSLINPPKIILHGKVKEKFKNLKIHQSVSHDGNICVGYVIVEI